MKNKRIIGKISKNKIEVGNIYISDKMKFAQVPQKLNSGFMKSTTPDTGHECLFTKALIAQSGLD